LTVVLLLATNASGQPSPTLAQLEKKAADAPITEKSAALIALSRAFEAVDTAHSLEVAQQARFAAATPHDQLLADARIATVLRRQGDYPGAAALAEPALARAIELHDDPARLELLLTTAQISGSLTDYHSAVAAYLELVSLGEKTGQPYYVGRGHLGLGVIYAESQQKPRARTESEIALRIATEMGDRESQADALNNLGNNYRGAGELDRATQAHEQALAIRTELGSTRGMGDSLVNLGEVARARGDFPMALDYTQRAFAIYEQLGLKRYLANTHLQFAQIFRLGGQPDEALAHLRTGFALAEALGSHTVLANYQREFAVVHEARGDFRAALAAQRQLAVENDVSVGEKTSRQVALLNARFNAARRQQEILLLRRDNAFAEAQLEQARWQRYGLLLALGLGTIAVAAIISRQRLKLRTDTRILAEARAAQKTAEHADRVKTRFLGIASHDIRNPLSNIVMVAEDLRATAAVKPERMEHLDLISSEAQRVINIVEDLLTTTALETGKLELRVRAIDLTEVTRTVVTSLRWQANAKRQQIDFTEPSAGTGRLPGDAARLQQVIANLLGNALKFSPPGATTRLSLSRADHTVTLAVHDRGPGLSPAEIEQLFAPYQRFTASPTATESSYGLGLSIAHEIVKLHGGSIRAESQLGSGTTFFVDLPAGET
jgi:signal transduction histidine kinase